MNALIFFKKISNTKIYLLASSPLLTIIMETKLMLLALFAIIFIDMITGIRKYFYQKKVSLNVLKKMFWKNLKSAGLRNTWRKTYEYGMGIIVFMILEAYILEIGNIQLLGKERNIASLAIAVAFVIEVHSVFENMEAVSGNNLLKSVTNLLPSNIKNIFKKIKESKSK